MDLTPLVAQWLQAQRYKDVYFEEPEEFVTVGEGRIAAFVADELEKALKAEDQGPNAIVAAFGVGSLFGFASVSDSSRGSSTPSRGGLSSSSGPGA